MPYSFTTWTRNPQVPLERLLHFRAGELVDPSLGASGIHRAALGRKLEGSVQDPEPLEPGHEEQRRAEEQHALALLHRHPDRVVGRLPPRIAVLHDIERLEPELADDPVHHEPERRAGRVGAARAEDDRAKPRAVGEQMTLEVPEQGSFVEARVREPHPARLGDGRAARLERDAGGRVRRRGAQVMALERRARDGGMSCQRVIAAGSTPRCRT